MIWLAGLMAVLAAGLLASLRFIPIRAGRQVEEEGTLSSPTIRLIADNTERDADRAEPDTLSKAAADETTEDWFKDAQKTFLDGFDPEQEDLILVWDDQKGPAPGVSLAPDGQDTAMVNVVVGDMILAQVRATPSCRPDHICAVPLSKARSLGWASA